MDARDVAGYTALAHATGHHPEARGSSEGAPRPAGTAGDRLRVWRGCIQGWLSTPTSPCHLPGSSTSAAGAGARAAGARGRPQPAHALWQRPPALCGDGHGGGGGDAAAGVSRLLAELVDSAAGWEPGAGALAACSALHGCPTPDRRLTPLHPSCAVQRGCRPVCARPARRERGGCGARVARAAGPGAQGAGGCQRTACARGSGCQEVARIASEPSGRCMLDISQGQVSSALRVPWMPAPAAGQAPGERAPAGRRRLRLLRQDRGQQALRLQGGALLQVSVGRVGVGWGGEVSRSVGEVSRSVQAARLSCGIAHTPAPRPLCPSPCRSAATARSATGSSTSRAALWPNRLPPRAMPPAVASGCACARRRPRRLWAPSRARTLRRRWHRRRALPAVLRPTCQMCPSTAQRSRRQRRAARTSKRLL